MGSEWLETGFMGVYANGRAVLLKITRIWGFDFLHSYHFSVFIGMRIGAIRQTRLRGAMTSNVPI